MNEGIEIIIFEDGVGSFTKITKPDFTKMTRQELKAYIQQHHTDDEAIRELFVNCRSPHAKTYSFPHKMTQEELTDIFRPKHNN
jgi:hypothetical protein